MFLTLQTKGGKKGAKFQYIHTHMYTSPQIFNVHSLSVMLLKNISIIETVARIMEGGTHNHLQDTARLSLAQLEPKSKLELHSAA